MPSLTLLPFPSLILPSLAISAHFCLPAFAIFPFRSQNSRLISLSGTDTLAIASVLECHTELAELRQREKRAQEALAKDENNEAASKELSGSVYKI